MNTRALKHIIDSSRREITIADVLLLPWMISDGLLIRETARNDSFVISYQAAKYRLKAAFVSLRAVTKFGSAQFTACACGK